MNQIFDARRVKLVAYCTLLAGLALQSMQEIQIDNGVWQNETSQALLGLFSGVIDEGEVVGFFVAHMMEYGVFLELANDRKYEILRPTAERFALLLKLYAQELYGAAA
jgi:hypothetical protein